MHFAISILRQKFQSAHHSNSMWPNVEFAQKSLLSALIEVERHKTTCGLESFRTKSTFAPILPEIVRHWWKFGQFRAGSGQLPENDQLRQELAECPPVESVRTCSQGFSLFWPLQHWNLYNGMAF